MGITIEDAVDYHLVRVSGDFDAELAPEARKQFSNLLENSSRSVKIDLSNVNFIDSSGIGAIVFLYKRLRCSGHDLVLDGLRQQPSELVSLLRIDRIIETHSFSSDSATE